MADYVGDAVTGLETSPVHVDQDSSFASSNGLENVLSGVSVAVVALPSYATETLGGQAAADSILGQTSGYDTVVVSVDNGGFFVAPKGGNEDVILTSIYANYTESGDAAQAIEASVPVMTSGATGASTSQTASSEGDGIGVVGAGGIFLALALMAAVGAGAFKRYLRTSGHLTQSAASISKDTLRTLPENLRKEMEHLEELGRDYHALQATNVVKGLNQVMKNSQELFTRVKNRGGEHQFNMAAVEYTDTFDKLSRALGRDYYMDILKNPNLWDNAEGRKAEVILALDSVAAQLIQNIREVNASQDLNFKVALEGLTKALDEVTVKDIYKDKE